MLSSMQVATEGLWGGVVCQHYADAAREPVLTEWMNHSGLSRRRYVAARGLLVNCSYLFGLSLGTQYTHASGMLAYGAVIWLSTFLRCGSTTPWSWCLRRSSR